MNTVLWIIAIVMGTAFVAGGVAKIVIPKEKVVAFPGGAWAEDFRPGSLKLLGVLDVLGGVGLVLPAALDIVPVLVPVAATGIVLLMIGAVVVRTRHGATRQIPVDLAYLALAAFVAIARFGPESF